MSETAPARSTTARRGRAAAVIFTAAVAFLAYARLLLWHASFTAGGSDSSGYVNTARLILTGRIVEPVVALKLLDLPERFLRVFLPLAFEPGPLRRVLVIAAFAVVLASETYWVRDLGVLQFGEGEKVYAEASRWAERKVPPHSLMVSMQMSGALRYYTNLIPVRWDRIEPEQVPVLGEHARTRGYQWFALLFPFENEELEKRLPWGWTKVGTLRNATLWRVDSAR